MILTDRQWGVLNEIEGAWRRGGWRAGWVAPREIGGSNGSFHSHVLDQLRRRGLAERSDRSPPGGEKTSSVWRITEEGRRRIREGR